MKYKYKVALFVILPLLLIGCGIKTEKIIGSNQIESCPNCVFSFYDGGKQYGEKGSILNDYTNNYKTLKYDEINQRRFFLGHILDDNKKILRGFACGIENGKAFCLEGTNDGSKYQDNIEILKEIYGQEKCEQFDDYIICKDELISGANINGTVDVGINDGPSCMAISNNTLTCE